MRFEDLAAAIEKMRMFEEEAHDRYRQSAECLLREELRLASRRVWPIGINHQVEFDAESVAAYRRMHPDWSIGDAVAAVIHLGYCQWKGVGSGEGPPTGFSSASLAKAVEIVRHIEAWVRGEVAELAPSGEWPPAQVA